MTYRILLILLIASGILQANHAVAQRKDDSPIQYEVGFEQHNLNYLTVDLTVQATGDETELMMAVWTPGSYLVREYARHIDSFSVTKVDDDGDSGNDGKQLDWKKTKKNRWLVQTSGVETFRVSYRLYCNDLSVRTNFVDGEFALINGAATFLTVPAYRDKPHEVVLNLPGSWSRSATSLAASSGKHAYHATSYDELVDSPIVAGKIEVFPFEVAGVPHQLVNVGDANAWDGAEVASDLKKIVKAQHELWGVVPYPKYLFINVICGRGGGLEHDNSTAVMSNTWTYRIKEKYKRWLSLASHEFFHTWNVRRLRPRALVNYDYENEVYIPSLWIAEGITSYFQDLVLVRSGLLSKKEYLKRLNSQIDSVQNRPGRLKQSLRDSSFDTWIKFYRPSLNSRDTQISYYSKGAVVGFLLDAQIRNSTDGEKSLDDVMKTMYEEFHSEGYLESDFRKVVAKTAGEDLSNFFDRFVDSTEELDFDCAKEWFGFRLEHEEEESDPETGDDVEGGEEGDKGPREEESAEKESDEQDKEDEKKQEEDKAEEDKKPDTPWLGFEISSGSVRKIQPDSPAETCGLNNGDELLAINGYRVDGDLAEKLKQFEVGDDLEVLISRRQKLMTKRLKVGIKPDSKSWKLKEIKNPTEDQKDRLQQWLGTSPDN